MKISLFDSAITLNDNNVLIILYCKIEEEKKEQHAVLLIETFKNDQHSLYSFDFRPAGPINDQEFGNSQRDCYNKIRLGDVRERNIPDLSGITKEEIFNKLHINDGIFFKNYRYLTRNMAEATALINQARYEKDHSPYFIYSGKKTDPDPVDVYNCITWIKHLFAVAHVKEPDATLLTRLISNTSGMSAEWCFGGVVPIVHTTETTSPCSVQ
jgi:hypothetical protein